MESSLLNLLERTRSIGTWLVDINEGVCHWSPATYAIHEEDPAKRIVVAEAIEYYVPEHRPIIELCIKEAIEEKKPWDKELQILTTRGKRRWVRAIGEPVFGADALTHLHGIFEDIDERKSLEVERETLLQRMIEGERIAKLGHWYWDIENDSLQWSPGVHKMFGRSENDEPLNTEQHMAIVHPADREALEQTRQDALTLNQGFEVNYRVVIDGKEKYIHTESFPRLTKDGKLSALVGVTIDRTNEFEARRKIEELNTRLMLALEVSQIGVWEWDIRTDALIWDNRMYALYGISEREFSGAYEAWQNGLHPDDREAAEAQIQHAVATNTKFDATFRVVWPNRTVCTIQGVADMILDDKGEVQRMVGVNWDITEVIAIRRELERSNEELAQFAYRSSHDLKGPLTSIRRVAAYMLQDLKDGDIKEVKRNVEQIEHRASAMESMVLGILDAAKAELTEAPAEPIDIGGIVREIVNSVEPLWEEKDVAVRSFVDCATPPNLPYIRLYQILYNLTSNGIKYANSERAERFVEIRATGHSAHLELSVEDNGQGLPDVGNAEPYKMFSRFHSDVSGSGLGLYIVKKHVESLGGDIILKTSPAGTRFELTIPYHRTPL
ncbi:MAG: PAS domain-containing protein [Gammaproteobacteria bacterium]